MAQSKKIGRNKEDCKRYASQNRAAINKAKRIAKHAKAVAKKAAEWRTVPRGWARYCKRQALAMQLETLPAAEFSA